MVAQRFSPPSASDRAVSETAELVSRRIESTRTPLPGQARVTVDGVLQHISNNPGSATSSSHDTLKRIWIGTCSVITETLSRTKGVSMPGFGVFTLQKKKHNRGNWGDKMELVASFCLLPSFCQNYGLHSSNSLQSSNLGAVATVPLNTVLIAMKAGVGKDECGSALKDIYRKFGELASKGATFSVDFGVARVVFHAHRYDVHWNQAFLQRLDSHCKGFNSRAIRGTSKRSNSRASSQKWYAADSLLPSGLDTENPLINTKNISSVVKTSGENRKRRPATAGPQRASSLAGNKNGTHSGKNTVAVVEKTAVPMRPSTAVVREGTPSLASIQIGNSNNVNSNNGIDTLREMAARPMIASVRPGQSSPNTAINRTADEHSVSALRSQLSEALHYGRNGNNDTSNEYPKSGTPPLSGDEDLPYSERTTYTSVDKYQQRLANKANHRRLRNKAYVAAWEEQKKAKALRTKAEKEIDAQRLSVMQQRSKKEEQNAQRDVDDRRRIARMVQQTNQQLSENRHSQRSSSNQRQNAVSWGETQNQNQPLDISYLMKQVDEQKKKKQREKHALEQAELTLLKQQQEKWKEEDAREFQTRQREKEERLEAYRKYKLNDCQKAVQEDKETVVGNFFFRGTASETILDQEKKEKEDRRRAALGIQEENQRGLEKIRQNKKMTSTLRKSTEKKRHEKLMKKAMEFEQREEEQRREERKQLKESWDNQILERQSTREAEKSTKQSTLHAWRNESSDEEYDDYTQPASPIHQKYGSRQKTILP